jgi:membrane associated rhomboid family serine protease/Tfp pilus assembly protein PilF
MANCTQCGRKLPGFTFGKPRNLCQWCVEYNAQQSGDRPAHEQIQPIMAAPWKQSRSHSMIVTQVFLGICVAVFIAMALSTQGASLNEPTNQQLMDWGANFGPRTLAGEWWRLITSVFVHIGILHIALNMWCLWSLGEMAEALYGHFTFAAMYLICGLAGSVASIAWHPATVSAGASGAIFGIAGALIASLKLGQFSAPGAVVKRMLSSVVTFAVYNLIFGAISGITDNAAHIGGLVAGLALGALIVLLAPQHDQPLRRVTALVIVLLAVICGAGWLQHARGYVATVHKAGELLDEHKPDQAIAELQTAIKQHPNDSTAHYYLAHAYEMKGRFAEEEAELNRALQLQPDSLWARYRLGVLYVDQHRTAEAKQVFAQMIASNHSGAEGHFGMGLALIAENSNERAIEEFRTAVKLDPATAGAYYNIGLSYEKLNKLDDAIASYKKALEVDGDDYDTENALADAYQAKGMPKEATEARTKAAQLKSAQQ